MNPGRIATARAKISGLLSAVPLRVTLTVLLALTAGLGLLVSGMVVTSALDQQLTDRTDQQLRDGAREWSRRPPPPPVLPPDPRHAPSQFYVRSMRSDGRVFLIPAFAEDSEPALPATPPSGPYTVDSANGGPIRWRVLTTRTPDGTTTVALPLTQNTDTVHRLVMLELVVGAVVLAVLAVLAYFVVRRSLRPLRRVESTAAAIARGDLHRRVPVRNTNTEVDRLSRSLNGMLAQIQRAFTATAASEEAARRSEERMRRFIADASHELRTPLTTIRGFAELYRQGATGDPAAFMDRIERESQRMGVLVEDLLMLARLDAQRPLELGPVDLLAVASDGVHNARAVVAAGHSDGPVRSIELKIEPGEGTLEVIGDEARLRQVLGNLLTNARTHTAPDAQVTVLLRPGPDDVLLEVADTGPGLPPEDAERVFERFYRTDSSRARSSGGTGLGLSIVQALVTAHGGEVGVRSSPGAGTTFTVRLPRKQPAEAS
ncbi:HAMP domain-containing histidine kinase [Nocardia beijingensis]|uniref:sensor histidine kinase n=1 Tax=Nocardia beijingensis TaxID=95162 RepID=UPI0018943883|nr:HAMP domain-containing sensor histidine kinase [Nocardia beijingensis]MBF6466273.1 HAMP domain-containing histidine kinase [Nocardia beijingensis]